MQKAGIYFSVLGEFQFEAGHLAQNLYLASKILKIKCCAVGGFMDKKIVEILDMIPKNELPLYAIVMGK